MSESKWTHTQKYLAGIVLAVALSAAGIYYASAQTSIPQIQGVVQFQDRSVCAFSDPFFSIREFSTIQQVDDQGVPMGSGFQYRVSDLGVYVIPITQTQTPGKLRVVCGSLVYDHALTQADISNGQVDIVLPNHTPVVTSLVARLNGQVVRGVPGGSTVTVSVSAADADGDVLHYAWGVTDGATTNIDTAQTTWTLPNSRGLHFLYVLVSDGNNGYREQQLAISTDGGVVSGAGAFHSFLPLITSAPPAPPPAVKPSDHAPAASHFLTYLGSGALVEPQDTRVDACAYYRDLGAVGGCTADGHPTGAQLTFGAWKQYWGFGLLPSNEVSATYANLADLNLQRDMHTLSRPGPRPNGGTGTDVASYVCNYPNTDASLSNVRQGNNLVACVAFEYAVTNNPTTGQPWNNGWPFTKFLTFGPTGDLLFSVNLDGRGEKFMPGTCSACHGGYASGRPYGTRGNPDLNSQFIPYDLDNYAFADVSGLRRPDQEDNLRTLNNFVKDTNPNPATVNLINGWYITPTSHFDGDFVPAGWLGHEALYLDVVKPSCRMCHVTLQEGYDTFDTYSEFAGWKFRIAMAVCGGLTYLSYDWNTMPNAKQTFDRFWLGIPGTTAVDQPAKLLQFLIAEGTIDPFNNTPVTTCTLPTWLP